LVVAEGVREVVSSPLFFLPVVPVLFVRLVVSLGFIFKECLVFFLCVVCKLESLMSTESEVRLPVVIRLPLATTGLGIIIGITVIIIIGIVIVLVAIVGFSSSRGRFLVTLGVVSSSFSLLRLWPARILLLDDGGSSSSLMIAT
jgi:hypothetical protein